MESARKESAAAFLWLNRSREVRRYAGNAAVAYLNILPRVIYPIFLILIGMSVAAGLKDRSGWEREIYLAAMFGLPFAFYPLFLLDVRFFAPVVPIALCWAGHGTVLAAEYLSTGRETFVRRRGLVVSLLAAALIAMHLWPVVRMVDMDPWSYPLEHKAAGEWLRVHGKPHARIMNRKAYVAYYADGEPFMTPYADYGQLLQYARGRAIDYLVVDERYTTGVRPALEFLSDGKQCPPELEVIYANGQRSGRRIVVYAIRDAGKNSQAK